MINYERFRMSVVARHYLKKIVEKYSVVKNFTPIFSYFHSQEKSSDHSDMCEKIKYGISRNPGSLHTFTWNTRYQRKSSVTDLIHFADKYKSQLIIDVNPHDYYAYFLWKGILHMYPETFVFPRYHADSKNDLHKFRCDVKNKTELMENITIVLPDDGKYEVHWKEHNSKNILLASAEITTSAEPTYATLTDSKNRFVKTLLYVPIVL
jgi:hypothetical protein